MTQMILNSDYRPLRRVDLPYKGRQYYMHAFDLSRPIMPRGYEDYLVPVLSLCRAANASNGIAYMTVDEKIVQAGMSQRRPKPHVDGCFTPQQQSWTHGGGNGWLHYCNDIQVGPVRRMPVIVASNVQGCLAWKGIFNGVPKKDGDLSHIQDQLTNGEVLLENIGYLLSPDCIHESMVFSKSVKRTFLRIALPVNYNFQENSDETSLVC